MSAVWYGYQQYGKDVRVLYLYHYFLHTHLVVHFTRGFSAVIMVVSS